MDAENLKDKDTFIVKLLCFIMKVLIIGAFCVPIWAITIGSFELLMSLVNVVDKEIYRKVFYPSSFMLYYSIIIIYLHLSRKK